MFEMEKLWSALGIIVPIVVVVLFILCCWRRVPADKAMVITGIKSACFPAGAASCSPFLRRAASSP